MNNETILKKNSYLRQQGVAFIELLFVTPIFVLFLVGISFFARYFITDIILNQAAQYAMFLIIHKNYDEQQVQNAIVEYVNDKYLLPGVKKEKLVFNIDLGVDRSGPAKVEVKYEVPLPNLISKIPKFPKPLFLRGYSECYNDTWYLGYPNNRSQS